MISKSGSLAQCQRCRCRARGHVGAMNADMAASSAPTILAPSPLTYGPEVPFSLPLSFSLPSPPAPSMPSPPTRPRHRTRAALATPVPLPPRPLPRTGAPARPCGPPRRSFAPVPSATISAHAGRPRLRPHPRRPSPPVPAAAVAPCQRRLSPPAPAPSPGPAAPGRAR